MSHIVSIATEVRDPVAIRSACQRMQLPAPVHGPTKLFSGTVTGWAVQLPNWRYPVVCDIEKKQLRFDDYGGKWGEQAQLDRFLQAYAVEMAKLAARRKGHLCTEQPLADGSIKLTVQVGGAT